MWERLWVCTVPCTKPASSLSALLCCPYPSPGCYATQTKNLTVVHEPVVNVTATVPAHSCAADLDGPIIYKVKRKGAKACGAGRCMRWLRLQGKRG